MDGGAEIVVVAGQRELKRPGGAAELRFRLEDVNLNAALCEGDGGG